MKQKKTCVINYYYYFKDGGKTVIRKYVRTYKHGVMCDNRVISNKRRFASWLQYIWVPIHTIYYIHIILYSCVRLSRAE